MNDVKTLRPKGFAALPPEVRSALAQKGGRAAHMHKTAHEWNHETAVAAGKKGAAKRIENLRRKQEIAFMMKNGILPSENS